MKRLSWSEQEFANVNKHLKNYDYEVDIKKINLENLKKLLWERGISYYNFYKTQIYWNMNPLLSICEPFSILQRN